MNYKIDEGRKCLQFDENLNINKSNSKADPEENGLVKSVSEKSNFSLGKVCAWQPSGALIAGHESSKTIVFWEKNGLRHGEFTLETPFDDFLVTGLYWSQDSDLLTVTLRFCLFP